MIGDVGSALLILNRVTRDLDPSFHIRQRLSVDRAEPVRRARLKNQDVTRADLSSQTALDPLLTPDDVGIGGLKQRQLKETACHQCPAPFQNPIDLDAQGNG